MVPLARSAAGRCVAPHLRCLRLCGFCRISPTSPHSLRILHYAYQLFALAVCFLYLIQECLYAYQERKDMEKLSRVMFLLLCHVTSLAKQLVFHRDAARVDDLIAKLDDPLLNTAVSVCALRVTSRRARTLQRVYAGTAVVTCSLWLVFPIARFVRRQPVDFPFWLPAEPSQPLAFAAVLMYSYYVTTLVGIANTTMDAFIGTILYQCTSQMTTLRTNLESLTERAEEAQKFSGEDFETVLLKLFYECLQHYNKIIEVTSSVQDIFGMAILIQFGIGGWILCMAAYKMVSLSVLSVDFASINLFIVCILTELFLYCYFGNELTYESARLLDSLYLCGWETWWGRGGVAGVTGHRGLAGVTGRRAAATVLLAGERARRPLRAAAAGLVPLSLETFLKILKSSYTFYAVLRQTK